MRSTACRDAPTSTCRTPCSPCATPGTARLADSVDLVMRGRNVIGDHWTFELVESYDADYISPFRAVEQAARETLGVPTHLFEAEMKAREQDAP